MREQVVATEDPLKCGGCGCDTFKLFHYQPHAMRRVRVGGEGSGGFGGAILIKCTKCDGVTALKPVPASLTAEWVEGDGALCGGWI